MKKVILILIYIYLPFSVFAQITTTIFANGASGLYTTGSAAYTPSVTYTRSDNAINVTNPVSPGQVQRGYAVFDLATIPAGASIRKVVLGFNVSGFIPGTYGTCNTYGWAGDLSTVTVPTTLYNDCAGGTLLWYATSPPVGDGSYGSSTGNNTMIDTMGSSPTAFIISNAGSKVSICFTGGGTNVYNITGETGSLSTTGIHAPYLQVTYLDTVPVFFIKFYDDANGDCFKNPTESYNFPPVLTEVDSNSIPVDTISATSGFFYHARGNPGDIYRFRIISVPTGFSAACPVSGIISDTLQSTAYHVKEEMFGLSCNPTTNFDLAEHSYATAGIHDAGFWITVDNAFCIPQPSTLTMNVSSKYILSYGTTPTPSSISGNTITWNLSSSTTPQKFLGVYSAIPGLTAADTFHYSVSVMPTTGDINPFNNSELILDTVLASSDPNGIAVFPTGNISSGTQLRYTIHFENDGNDTAYNIYVMDTLSDNVDPKSLRIVTSTAVMNVYNFISGGHNIVKFDFPNINLLDSTHHGLCDDMFVFNVNAKSGLPFGTTIFNHAGIFFDYNPVVVTNYVENIIGFPAGVATINNNTKVEIYPNPATDELTIKMEQDAYTSCVITNSIGQVLMEQPLSGTGTKVNVKTLSAGLYYITVKGDAQQGSGVPVTRKFVKL